jgi:cytochrome P450
MFEIYSWYKNPYQFLEDKKSIWGDTFYLDFKALGKSLITGDEKLIEEIQKNKLLVGGIGSQFLHHLVGPSMITLEGPDHIERRRKLNPYFFNLDEKRIIDLTNKALDQEFHHFQKNRTISMIEWTNSVTLRTIIKYVFDEMEIEEENEVFNLISEWKKSLKFSAIIFLKPLQLNISKYFGWGKYLEKRSRVHQFILNKINQREKNNGLLSKMIEEFEWKKEELLFETISILMFGHDTTAILIGWWTKHMLTNKNWDSKLSKELIESSLKETARITPPVVHLTRVAKEDTQVGQFKILKNQKILPCIYLSHMNNSNFPDPSQFKLDRFLNKKSISPYQYYPFGFGDRLCLGKFFAEIQTNTIAKRLLENVELSLVDKNIPSVRQFFLMVPKHGTRVKVVRFL